jgi:hypothetical protein
MYHFGKGAMEQLTEGKVCFCYSLMDSAYDSKTIDEYIRGRGERLPKSIICFNGCGNMSGRPEVSPIIH